MYKFNPFTGNFDKAGGGSSGPTITQMTNLESTILEIKTKVDANVPTGATPDQVADLSNLNADIEALKAAMLKNPAGISEADAKRLADLEQAKVDMQSQIQAVSTVTSSAPATLRIVPTMLKTISATKALSATKIKTQLY